MKVVILAGGRGSRLAELTEVVRQASEELRSLADTGSR